MRVRQREAGEYHSVGGVMDWYGDAQHTNISYQWSFCTQSRQNSLREKVDRDFHIMYSNLTCANREGDSYSLKTGGETE